MTDEERIETNKDVWNAIGRCLKSRHLSWKGLSETLNVPATTLSSNKQKGRNPDFLLLLAILNLLEIEIYVSFPDRNDDTMELIRAISRGICGHGGRPLANRCLADTLGLVKALDGLKHEDKLLLLQFAERLHAGPMPEYKTPAPGQRLMAPVYEREPNCRNI